VSSQAVASAIATELASAGSDIMFGIPGGGNNLEIIGAAEAAGIRFVLAHTETAATIMAATYADLTQRPTASVVTRGPGAASAINGVAQAFLDRQPLLLLTDTVSQVDHVRIAHQRLSQGALFSAVTKWTGTVGGGDAAATIRGAISITQAPPWGPVHLDFDPTTTSSQAPVLSTPVEVAQEQIDAAINLLRKSRKPVIALGLASRRIADQLRDLVQDTNLPVLMTYRAKGVIPDSWDNTAGLFTGGTVEASVLDAADLILTIGLDTVELIPNEWKYTASVLSVSTWAEKSPYFRPALEVVGELSTLMDLLQEHIQDEWEVGFGQARRTEGLDRLAAGPPASDGIAPKDVVLRVRAACPDEVIATVDAGAHMLTVMPLWETDLVDGILISSGLATMGFALPAAIAAAFARPDRRIVCFVGDGGLGMVLAELETVVRYNLPITVVVFNDSKLSLIAVKAKLDGHGGPNAISYLESDFALAAAAFRMPSGSARTIDELDELINRSISQGGPMLIDVKVDPNSYPHVLDAIRGSRKG
jgi:acetolactate synthase-1/2/3 large subunit